MKIFDFNIHLPYIQSNDVMDVIGQDATLDITGISKGLAFHAAHFKAIDKANILLFNTSLFDSETANLQTACKGAGLSEVRFTNLVDFRKPGIEEYIRRAKESGVSAIVFNSYLQKISDEDFPLVLRACQVAEELKMVICIDGSYGTSKMHTYHNNKLACFIADHVTKAQIVIVHSGGLHVLNAMLLALDKKNVWLDTSFSLPYYIGSSIEMDFAFAYRKMDYQRIVYGSDHPYVSITNAIDQHKVFFERFAFPASAVENIFNNNASDLFNEY